MLLFLVCGRYACCTSAMRLLKTAVYKYKMLMAAEFASVRSFRRMPSIGVGHLSSADIAASTSVPLLATPEPDPSATLPLNAMPMLPEVPHAPASSSSRHVSNAAGTDTQAAQGVSAALGGESAALSAGVDASQASSRIVADGGVSSFNLDDLQNVDEVSSLGMHGSSPDASPTAVPRGGAAHVDASSAALYATGKSIGDAFAAPPPVLSTIRATGLPAAGTTTAMCPLLVPTGAVEVVSRRQRSRRSDPGDLAASPFAAPPTATETAVIVPDNEDCAHSTAQQGASGLDGREGQGGDRGRSVVALGAVGTEAGTVEVVKVAQGTCQPLSLSVLRSYKVCTKFF